MNKNKKLTLEETFNLGVKAYQSNNLNLAKNLYNEVLLMEPEHLVATSNLGAVFLGLGDYPKAKSYFKKAIKIDPNYLDAHNNLGITFKALNAASSRFRFRCKTV